MFVGQLGCKIISGKRLQSYMVSGFNNSTPSLRYFASDRAGDGTSF